MMQKSKTASIRCIMSAMLSQSSSVLACSDNHTQVQSIMAVPFMLLKSERIIIPSLVTYRQEIIGIYHGVSKRVSKRELPLFVNKQVYRYNHRKIGRNMLDEIAKYLRLSSLMPGKGNHSVIGSGNDLFCSLMCQVATHSIRKIDQII